MTDARRSRYDGREFARSVTRLGRLSACGRTVVREGGVQLRVTAEGRAGLAGVSTCGSVWACPVCSAKILASRTTDVQQAVERWLALGERHAVGMFTVTVQHTAADRLGDLLDSMSAAWARMAGTRSWKKLRARVGWVHQIRTLEIKYGEQGWHPHYHVLVFLERPLSDDRVADAAGQLAAQWIDAVQKVGRRASPLGQDFRVFSGDRAQIAIDAGAYVSKERYEAPDSLGIAYEMTRGDLKTRGASVTAFQLLANMLRILREDGGDLDAIAHLLPVWREYEKATKGRRAQLWSRGLRALLHLETDRTDDELAAECVGTADDAVMELSGSSYRKLTMTSPGAVCGLLEATEAGFAVSGRNGALAAASDYLRSLRVKWRAPWSIKLAQDLEQERPEAA